MTTSASCPENEGLNVYWKIKNFSYCYESIISPKFGDYYQYCLGLSINSCMRGIRCQLLRKAVNWIIEGVEKEISFLTCDGSPELLISSGTYVSKEVIFGKRRNAFLPEDTLTVRFRDPTSSKRGKLLICSQIGVNSSYFLWTFKDFCKGRYDKNKTVEESELYGRIELNLKSMRVNNLAEQFSIEITRARGERCYCVLKVSMVEVGGKAVNEVCDEFIFEKKDDPQTRGFPMIIKKNKLLACKNLLLPNDTLTLKCFFAISLGKVTSFVSYCENASVLLKETKDLSMSFNEKNCSGYVTELQTDLKSMLDDGTLHDASLQIGSEVIRAHKTILSARSPVFRAMFTQDMKEAMNSAVVIEDLDVETVRGLLLYMYTDTIHEDEWESMKKLYLASDKYEVLSLKDKCASFLKTNLSVSNVCESLLLADLHQDEDLKKSAFDFISEYDSAVFASEAWRELEKNNSSLALQIMRDLYCNKRIKSN